VLPETLRFNAIESAAPLGRVAAALGLDEQQPAASVAGFLEDMRESLGIPATLRDAGVRERDLPAVAAAAAAFTELNPRPAGAEELLEILRAVR
jgi:lactaldehyde reductase